jgi:CRISPR/Cas system endoribonuclease Cas6 (RAMP superfamily)
MKTGVIFSGSGPILILTTFDSFLSEEFSEKLAQKGIKKYIAFEVDIDLCRERYGDKFDAIFNDVKHQDDLRILDYNGYHVFHEFSFKELGQPQFRESLLA